MIFSTPRRLARISAWREHIPFGMFLVDVLRPRVLVELGTHWGNSYCAFCQAVDELRLSTTCYAVDTWEGDDQSGRYGPEVLADLRAHHDPLYGTFSRLVESTFDEALEHFADASIDLLHVDGLHTYEAVKHDVAAWWPKLSNCGVLLLHDINARRREYGVWKLWEELKVERPYLELNHAHGLGVLAVGDRYPDVFRDLLDAPEDAQRAMRELFFALGYRLRLQLHVEDGRRKRSELHRAVDSERAAWQEAMTRVVEAVEKKERENSVLQDELCTLRPDRDAVRAELAALRRRKFVRLGMQLDSVRRRARRQEGVSDLSRGHEPRS